MEGEREMDRGEMSGWTHGKGGLGSKSTFSISSKSSLGSEQKYNGLSPGTLNSSLIVIWVGSQVLRAETVTTSTREARTAVSFIVASGGTVEGNGWGGAASGELCGMGGWREEGWGERRVVC